MSELEELLAPTITFARSGGYTVECPHSPETIWRHLTILAPDGVIRQVWYDGIELPVEQEHEKTVVHLTECIELSFWYRKNRTMWMDMSCCLTPAYLDRRRRAHDFDIHLSDEHTERIPDMTECPKEAQ